MLRGPATTDRHHQEATVPDIPMPTTAADVRYSDVLRLLRIEAPQLGALLDELDTIVSERLGEAEDSLLADLSLSWGDLPLAAAQRRGMV